MGLLGCIFVTLKLLGKIDWSWWWVAAPFWGGLALILAILAVLGIAWLVLTIVAHLTDPAARATRRFR